MALLFQDLRSNVIGCSTNGFLCITFVFYLGGQSEVANFGIHLVVDKNISEFQVSVYNPLRMNINHGFYNLTDIDSSLKLSKSLPSFGQVFKCIVSTILKKNIDVLLVLKGINEFDNMAMLKRFVYLDLD